MKAFLNRALFEQTTFDSATPSGTAMVVHQFQRNGRFTVALARGDEVVRRLALNVSPAPAADRGVTESAGEAGSPPAAITVDLAAGDQDEDRPLTVAAG